LDLSTAGHAAFAALGPAPLGETKGEVEQALAGGAGDHHGIARDLVVLDRAPAARGEQPFGGLAQDHEVDLGGARVGERRLHVGEALDRADPGVEAEGAAHLEVRRDLGAVRIAHVGQAHGAEQDGIRRLALCEVLVRERHTGIAVVGGAARQRLLLQLKAEAALQRLEHRDRRVHDLDADAVARQHSDPKRRVHPWPPLRRLQVPSAGSMSVCVKSSPLNGSGSPRCLASA
jgi:hypothetical protein